MRKNIIRNVMLCFALFAVCLCGTGCIASRAAMKWTGREEVRFKNITTVRLKYRGTICKEIELFRSIPVWRVLQGIPVQIEDLDQSEV